MNSSQSMEKEKVEKIKLNLGCGEHKLEGWINLDKEQLDLNKLPYNLPDNYADEILVLHVLEHLYIPIYEAILELHRILKPNGKLIIKLPINSNIVAHQKDRFNIYYFNELLDNPIGQFAVVDKSSKQAKALFHLTSYKKTRNWRLVLFNERLGGAGDKITGYKKDWVIFLKYLPHRIWDMLFNGEIEWIMKAIKT